MSKRRQNFRLLHAIAASIVTLLAACDSGSGDRSSRPAEPTAPRAALAAAAADPVIVAAGDIVCGTGTPAGDPCKHAQTAALIGGVNPAAVLLLGDNQYENGTLADYNTYYAPTWGAYKSITRPAPGNHEYNTANAKGYYDYFNGVGVQTGRAGDRSKGYYSYDVGAWHLIAINSNCGPVGGCGAGSAQERWLRADLAAHPTACTLAYWHHPRFTSGAHGNDATMQAIWQALVDYDADLVLAGHDHDYERFAPQTAAGALDNVHGVRSFVVGTGGKEQRSFSTIRANSQFRSSAALGVLKLTLHPTSFDWQFLPIPGQVLNDAGTASCHAGGNQAPTATITVPAANATFAQGASVTFTGAGTDPESGALTGGALVWTSSRDGQLGTGTTFSRSNLSVGAHTITLTATDTQGATGTATRTLTITAAPPTNQPPVANFTISNCNAQWHRCTLDGTVSTDDQGIVSYTWNLAGGYSDGPTQPRLNSRWPAAGVYTVTLTVTDTKGLTATTSRGVTVP